MYLTGNERTEILLEAIQDAEKQANEDGGSYVCLRTAFDMMLAVAKRHPDWPKPEPAPTADSLKVDPFVKSPVRIAKKTPEPETEFREPERLLAEPETENEVSF